MADTIGAGGGEGTTGQRAGGQHAGAAGTGGDVPPTPRGLLITVIVLGVLLVLGFVAVFGTITYRVMDDEGLAAQTSARQGFGTSEVLIDPQAQVRSVTLADGRLAIHVIAGDHDDIILIDAKRGHELGRVRVRANTDLAVRR